MGDVFIPKKLMTLTLGEQIFGEATGHRLPNVARRCNEPASRETGIFRSIPFNKLYYKSILQPFRGWELSIHFSVKFFLVTCPPLT